MDDDDDDGLLLVGMRQLRGGDGQSEGQEDGAARLHPRHDPFSGAPPPPGSEELPHDTPLPAGMSTVLAATRVASYPEDHWDTS